MVLVSQSHTHDTWVWVQTGTGTGTLKYTHGLPVSNTIYYKRKGNYGVVIKSEIESTILKPP